MSNITIYKASAGSGKTYTLTREYLKIIFENENSYKNILAVTFTNKAAEEMKGRIVKEVYLISIGSNKSDHVKFLKEKFNLTDIEVKNKANNILNSLLHDYSHFSVGTIDSFFQKIIRSFAKEIGLQTGFQLELDKTEILEKAVDEIFTQVDNDKQLYNWLLTFANDRMRDGKSWNFKDEITKIGNEIFKEEYSIHSVDIANKLKEKGFIDKFKKSLVNVKENVLEKAKKIGNDAVDFIESAGVTFEDFPYKNTSFASYFLKLQKGIIKEPGKRTIDALNDVTKWYSKSSDKILEIESVYETGGNLLLNSAVEFYFSQSKIYNSAEEVLKLVNSFAIITDIAKNAHKISSEENIFLLAFAGPFIKSIIADTDTPFLYEKIGTRYKYFMIDEFQDTSTIQWDNFLPLISESLANSNSSILVGDVKQSIYRWRNGDWKLLAGGVDKAFYEGAVLHETLTDNWRSKKNIIEFNNKIFKHIAEILQNDFNNKINLDHEDEIVELKTLITDAYADVSQNYPTVKNEKENGYVKVEFVADTEEQSARELILAKIPEFLEQLQDKNHSLKDVAILVRNNREGAEIVNYLMAYKNSDFVKQGYKYDVISNEALIIGNSPIIKFLVGLLKDVFNNDDDVNTAFLKYEYSEFLQTDKYELDNIFKTATDILPKEYSNNRIRLRKLSLYEIIEELISIFKLNKNRSNYIYLQAFKDKTREFADNNNTDIDSFMQWWQNKGSNLSVSINENQDAVKIISIHKSKGLEFKTVLIPFASWKFKPVHNSIFWCESEVQPYNQLKVIPLRDSNKIQETVFYKDFYNEKLHNYIDNINLLYVAFTRAKENLVAFVDIGNPNKKTNKKDSLNNLSKLLQTAITTNNNILEIGELYQNDKLQVSDSINELTEYISVSKKETINIKLSGNDFVKSFENEKIRKGILYHKIFENIKYKPDVDKAILELVNKALINETEFEKYQKEINDIIENEEVRHWFDGTYKIKNEASIIDIDKIKRPDRLMLKDDEIIIIDYKFGEKQNKKYNKQLKEYAEIITKMGFVKVKSYIWYVVLGVVVLVD